MAMDRAAVAVNGWHISKLIIIPVMGTNSNRIKEFPLTLFLMLRYCQHGSNSMNRLGHEVAWVNAFDLRTSAFRDALGAMQLA
jgi:hypothetical protein